MAGGAGTELSRGGMVTKIEAGKIALASGTNMVITLGQGRCIPCAALSRGRALHLVPGPVRSRDRAQALDRRPARAQGQRRDRRRRREGAALGQEPAAGRRQARARAPSSAAMRSSSAAPTGASWGAGSSPMRATTRRASSASKSGEIAAILGYAGRAELVHRDDMVLSKSLDSDMTHDRSASRETPTRRRRARCGRIGRAGARGGARAGAGLDRGQERRAAAPPRASCGRRPRRSSRPTSATSRPPREAGRPAAFLDRLTLDPKRIEAHGQGARGDRRAARSRRQRDRAVDAAERPRASSACACRSASSASSTRAGPT